MALCDPSVRYIGIYSATNTAFFFHWFNEVPGIVDHFHVPKRVFNEDDFRLNLVETEEESSRIRRTWIGAWIIQMPDST